MTEYIPYSTRHNITDKDLAGLLDYLERIMGWDIEMKNYPEVWGFSIISGGWRLHIDKENSGTASLTYSKRNESSTTYTICIREIWLDLFYRTYKTLLPVIRDLYSK